MFGAGGMPLLFLWMSLIVQQILKIANHAVIKNECWELCHGFLSFVYRKSWAEHVSKHKCDRSRFRQERSRTWDDWDWAMDPNTRSLCRRESESFLSSHRASVYGVNSSYICCSGVLLLGCCKDSITGDWLQPSNILGPSETTTEQAWLRAGADTDTVRLVCEPPASGCVLPTSCFPRQHLG